MKAFLSHSTEDKQFVEVVAQKLGRVQAEFDRMSFSPGYDFRELIRKSLGKSNLFIFFASKKSLDSSWVKFEIDEAEWQSINQDMAGAITIIIDQDVKPQDIPKWMQRCLVVTTLHPVSAAHIIQNHLIQIDTETDPIFIGREKDLADFSHELIRDVEKTIPRVLIIAGLDGIGRKTFGSHAVKNYLSMESGYVFIVEETDSIDSLYLQLVNETSDLKTREKLAEYISTFRALNIAEKGQEIARLLALINKDKFIPVIVDKSGKFLDDNTSWYKVEWQAILEGLNKFNDTYLILIQPRLPYFANIPDQNKIPALAQCRLGPLANDAIELILKESARKMHIAVSTEQLKEIVPYINGYPPAVHYVFGFIKNYGVDVLLADKGMLSSFMSRRFEVFLEKLRLSDKEKEVLKILEAEISLPFEALRVIISCTEIESAKIIQHLVDLCLIIHIDNDYIIAPPIKYAVSHMFGVLTKKDYTKIANILRKEFWVKTEVLPKLSIIDTVIHALAYSDLDELYEFKDLILPGQLFKVAQEKYNNHDWRGAENLARRALQLDNNLHGARIVLIKALIRQKRWNLAEEELGIIEKEFRRERFYLRGFMEWKKGHNNAAVNWFRRGWEAGDTSISTLRDSAYCLFIIGDMDNAKFFIDLTLAKSRNKYHLDLAAQIAIYSDRIKDAEQYLDEIKNIDQQFYFNRRATLRIKQNRLNEALNDIEKAISTEYPMLDTFIQRVDIFILLDKPEAEEELLKLEPMLGEKSDIKRGLWCKYYLRKGDWLIAEDWWNKIWQKELPSFKDLRKTILKQKAEDIMVPVLERNKATEEYLKVDLKYQLPLMETDFEEATKVKE